MSRQIDQNFLTSFDALVKHVYQDEMKLRGTVRTKGGVVGASHRFPIMDQGMAHERIPRTDVIPMGIGQGRAEAFLKDWVAPEYSDIFELAKTNIDERKELAQVVAKAMGRRFDQTIIDALKASTFSKAVTVGIGGNNTLNLKKILRAKRIMDENGVPTENRHFALHPASLEQLLGVTEVTSADFNTVRALADGSLRTYAGFQFHFIANRKEGGLPQTGTTTISGTSFAWHTDAVGLAIGMDIRTSIDWIAEKTSWLINGMFSAGAVTIDPKGAIKITSEWTNE